MIASSIVLGQNGLIASSGRSYDDDCAADNPREANEERATGRKGINLNWQLHRNIDRARGFAGGCTCLRKRTKKGS